MEEYLRLKKVLILGGASVHVKLAAAAKELGYYTIVTDYLEDSPAKSIADESWLINVMDVNTIVEECKKENVAGVVSGWLDPCQRPYQEICEKLGLPCYGTKEQFFKMTDKHAFKDMCIKNGVDVIPEYSMKDVEEDRVEYPVFVKPVDSRGSRGQAICNTRSELDAAREDAIKESSSGEIIIEKYIGNTNSFQVTYFFVNGEAFLIRTADGYKGLVEEKLDKVALCSISPSVHTELYMHTTHERIVSMLKNMGFKNGPAMLQGFNDNGVFRFYDPGLRFPGVEYDLIYKELYGIDVMKEMVRFAVTGRMEPMNIKNEFSLLSGKAAAVLFPTVSAGTIASITDMSELNDVDKIVAVSLRHGIGDTVDWTYNVSQRLGEIDLYDDDLECLIEMIKKIQAELKVTSVEGHDMMYMPFKTERISRK